MTPRLQSIPRPWWSYMRLSLGGFMVLVLAVGGGLGWTARSARVQRAAVDEVRRCSGQVVYDWQLQDGLPRSNAKPPWPQWLVDLVGADHLGSVVGVLWA